MPNRVEAIRKAEMQHGLTAGALDVTLPGRPRLRGRLHPATLILREIYDIWAEMGFQVYRARDVETDEYNFQLLNIPPLSSGARYVGHLLYDDARRDYCALTLRRGKFAPCVNTARSPFVSSCRGCAIAMNRSAPRRTFNSCRSKAWRSGKNIRMGDLLGTMTEFNRRIFGPDRKTRFRASYFPFTEPSVEVDVSCANCGGTGCGVCKYTGWLEIAGCGHGASDGVEERRLRSGSVQRLRLWHGAAAHRHVEVGHQRHSLFLGRMICGSWSSSKLKAECET